MLTYCVFIGGDVYTIDFVVRDVALNPLNLITHSSQNCTGLLGYRLELLRRQVARLRNVSLDNELRHGIPSFLILTGEEFDY
jgi:hypothetical protein